MSMRRSVLIFVTVALLAAIASPVAAAPPAESETDTASAVLASDNTYVTVDGYASSAPGVLPRGAVEVFGGGLECFEPDPTFAFDVTRLSEARVSGTGILECWDFAAERSLTATVAADVSWIADGEPSTARYATGRNGCTNTVTTVQPSITGTVTVAVEGREPITAAYAASNYDRFAYEVSRCPVKGAT